jgi:voltage-gated potassium channel
LGKFLGAIVALFGIGIFALPAGIIASGFNEEMQKRQTLRNKTQPIICPHCGKEIEDNR